LQISLEPAAFTSLAYDEETVAAEAFVLQGAFEFR